MKRFGLALAVCCLAAATAGVGGASAGNDNGGRYDFVSGAIKRVGYDDSVERHFILSAHQTPQGPTGRYTATYGKGSGRIEYKGDVTCINVVGNVAKVGILVTESTHPVGQPIGYYEILRVTDYGEPSGDGQMDSLSPATPFTVTPADCSAPITDPTPTYAGNFTVHDGG